MLRTIGLVVALAMGSIARAEAADVEIFGGLAFLFPRLDTRYDASYTPSRVVSINQLFTDPDPSTNVITIPLQQIEEFLALPPVEIDGSCLRVLVGLKWKL